jgi:hypothetical protein
MRRNTWNCSSVILNFSTALRRIWLRVCRQAGGTLSQNLSIKTGLGGGLDMFTSNWLQR